MNTCTNFFFTKGTFLFFSFEEIIFPLPKEEMPQNKGRKKKKKKTKHLVMNFIQTPKDMLDLESEESGEQEETKMNTKSNA